jgi:hypothetical protein
MYDSTDGIADKFGNVTDLLSSECEVLTANPDQRVDRCTYVSSYI